MSAESGPENLDDLMMGNVSEGSEETSESIAARIAAAQAKLAKVQKDEKQAHDFDEKLAKILKEFSYDLIDFVAFLIDKEVPSLTILAIIALANNEAGKICYTEFHKTLDDNYAIVPLLPSNKKEAHKIELWLKFIHRANTASKTLKLSVYKKNKEFVDRLSAETAKMLKEFLIKNKVAEFDEEKLKKALIKYEKEIFAED
jgi:hypothetical protein